LTTKTHTTFRIRINCPPAQDAAKNISGDIYAYINRTSGGGGGASCGDNSCNNGETCSSCSADCGTCSSCDNDGVCDTGEGPDNCANDCGGSGSYSYYNQFDATAQKLQTDGNDVFGLNNNCVKQYDVSDSYKVLNTYCPSDPSSVNSFAYCQNNGKWAVLDRNNKKVYVYSSAFGSSPTSFAIGFSDGAGIGCNPDNNDVYVVRGSGEISAYSQTGTEKWTYSGGGSFNDIASDGDYVYPTDAGNGRVLKLSASSGTRQTFSASAELSNPTFITVWDGKLFLSDTGNYRIVGYSKSGSSSQIIGGQGGGNGKFQNPRGVTGIGSYLYSSDPTRGIIQIFQKQSN